VKSVEEDRVLPIGGYLNLPKKPHTELNSAGGGGLSLASKSGGKEGE